MNMKGRKKKKKTRQKKACVVDDLGIVISFSITPRATVHNTNNVLTLAISEHKSPFLEEFDCAYITHLIQFWPAAQHSTNNAMSVGSP